MPFSISRRCIVVAISLALAQAPVLAQEAASRHEINLPEQSLADSLRALGKAAHVNIVFEPEAVQGKRAPVLSGDYTPTEALEQLLAGSGLGVRPTAGGSYSVEPKRTASASTGEGATVESGRVHGDAYTFDPLLVIGKAEGFSATRMPTALKDIPQSVSIITKETMQEQNVRTLDQAFERVTGITMSRTSSVGFDAYSRGFNIYRYHVDGGAPVSMVVGNPAGLDLSEYEQLEILRGSDALFGGAGLPSASINLTRKRPLAEAASTIAVSAGSWNNYRAEVDLSDQISADGRLRGRLVGVRDDQHYYYDNAYRHMGKLYAVLDYDVSDSTRLTLGGSYENARRVPVLDGLPRYSDGSDPRLPRSTGLTYSWAMSRSSNNEVFLQMEQGLGERWRVKAGISKLNSRDTGPRYFATSSINMVTGLFEVPPRAIDNTSRVDQLTWNFNLNGSFDWNGRAQEVVVGMDSSRSETVGSYNDLIVSGPVINPFDFNPSLYPRPQPVSPLNVFYLFQGIKSRQTGIYAAVKLRPLERWAITLGARNNFERGENHTIMRQGSFTFVDEINKDSDTGVVTPYAGVVYEINTHYSLYASYAQVYTSNGGAVTANGSLLGPARGTNLEAGIKGAWHDGRLNGSFVLFKIDQSNVQTRDFNNPGNGNGRCCVIGATHRSKGVEAELSGLLMPGWQLSAGYTFNINRSYSGSALSSQTPRHLFKLWTSYQLPGRASAWNIGGGVLAQTENYVQSFACPAIDQLGNCVGKLTPYRSVQGFYSVTTLRVDYRLSDHWNLALNVDNLFDRTYYQTIAGPYSGSWYGTPRSWMLTLRGQF